MQPISKIIVSGDAILCETKKPNIIPSDTAVNNDHKKRVAIIAMFHGSTNYGGVLQAFALFTLVKSFGFACDVIRYVQSNIKPNLKSVVLKRDKETCHSKKTVNI